MGPIDDLFGYALQEYAAGKNENFYFLMDGIKQPHDLSRYFRPVSELSTLERRMISLTKGRILDVGCGTANYFPALAEQGSPLGIDTSQFAIDLAVENGHNCKVADIFSFQDSKRFDTITLFENNIGLAGTVDRAELLLRKLANLLSDNGQILLIQREARVPKYFVAELTPVWGKLVGKPFKWLILSSVCLKGLCEKVRLDLEIIDREGEDVLVRMSRS